MDGELTPAPSQSITRETLSFISPLRGVPNVPALSFTSTPASASSYPRHKSELLSTIEHHIREMETTVKSNIIAAQTLRSQRSASFNEGLANAASSSFSNTADIHVHEKEDTSSEEDTVRDNEQTVYDVPLAAARLTLREEKEEEEEDDDEKQQKSEEVLASLGPASQVVERSSRAARTWQRVVALPPIVRWGIAIMVTLCVHVGVSSVAFAVGLMLLA